jgi:hypothetical protein
MGPEPIIKTDFKELSFGIVSITRFVAQTSANPCETGEPGDEK